MVGWLVGWLAGLLRKLTFLALTSSPYTAFWPLYCLFGRNSLVWLDVAHCIKCCYCLSCFCVFCVKDEKFYLSVSSRQHYHTRKPVTTAAAILIEHTFILLLSRAIVIWVRI
uniref:Uncharacterized protein n=1 Tax=Glossina brevipalpis TaxID=37001 RepID=A0A1A9X507_9MUSC